MSTTLTDRYVWAVTRLLPEHQRPEIRHELEASIADMIDAEGDGTSERADGEAEVQVLTELGDPRLLAARYADRPRYVIGPDIFPDYLRVLKAVAAVVLPIVAAVAAVGAILADGSPGEVISAAVGTMVNGAVHVAFWITVGFMLFADRPGKDEWTLESLPDVPSTRPLALGETIAAVVLPAVMIAALFWARAGSPLTTPTGEVIPLLDPSLWNGWAQTLVAVLLAAAALEIVVYRAGRWTWTLATVNAVLNTVLLGLMTWVAIDHRFVNPAFLEALAREAELDQVPTVNAGLVILAVGAVTVWSTIEGFLKALRAQSAD